MKIIKKALAALLTLMLLMGLLPMTATTTFAETTSDTLVVGYSEFSGVFSSLFCKTAYDEDVASMTTIHLINSDRKGAIVDLGKTGVTRSYNGTNYTYYGPADLTITENDDGTVYYDFTLREDIKFSDGEPLTADDVIFSMYALADPSYDGMLSFYSLPIKGMDAYRTGYAKRINLIADAGRNNTDFTSWTEDQQKEYWHMVDTAPLVLAEEIANFCWENGYATQGDVSEAAREWGFYVPENGTLEDFAAALIDFYGDNVVKMIETETVGSKVADFLPDYESFMEGVVYGDSAENIEGIQKTGQYSLRVILTKVSASASYQFSIPILPLHYYGDSTKYDYSNNKFGFDKGDLSTARAKTSQPMGAGPYKFIRYTNGVVYFEANEQYYLGAPKTKYVQFKGVSDSNKLSAITSGQVDIIDPSMTADVMASIKEANSNGELTGDKLTTALVNNMGYGYLGISANVVKVGTESGSDASKNLRKAFATVLSRFREQSVADFYGDCASVINYPISDTSWAAPQKTDPDYEVAFSRDINNKQIYLDSMTEEEKTVAAIQAALGYFQAAGYTVSGGKVTAAPAGAKMEYEVWIPGGGVGDHPACQMAQSASNALATIGITLTINDLQSSADLWSGIQNEQVPMWCAAWGAATDPDMYQIYYSDIESGGRNPGGSNYMYDIADAELDRLILRARSISDLAQRKVIYRQCLDIIMDWAVEVPVYQRQNGYVFSTERVDISTVTPDITTFYGWMHEVQNIKKTGQSVEPQKFPDVAEGAWYYEVVYQIAQTTNANGKPLMSGYASTGKFGPADPLTRQDFAVILYRLANEPEVPPMENPFSDTKENGYYYTCVLWAKANNVIAGYNDGRFGVGDKITREQVATILYRFAKDYMKIDTSEALGKGDLTKFKDGKAISSWAEEALTWATGAGVITGKSNGTMIDARGNAARAEIGAMIIRFIAYITPTEEASVQ